MAIYKSPEKKAYETLYGMNKLMQEYGASPFSKYLNAENFTNDSLLYNYKTNPQGVKFKTAPNLDYPLGFKDVGTYVKNAKPHIGPYEARVPKVEGLVRRGLATPEEAANIERKILENWVNEPTNREWLLSKKYAYENAMDKAERLYEGAKIPKGSNYYKHLISSVPKNMLINSVATEAPLMAFAEAPALHLSAAKADPSVVYDDLRFDDPEGIMTEQDVMKQNIPQKIADAESNAENAMSDWFYNLGKEYLAIHSDPSTFMD